MIITIIIYCTTAQQHSFYFNTMHILPVQVVAATIYYYASYHVHYIFTYEERTANMISA